MGSEHLLSQAADHRHPRKVSAIDGMNCSPIYASEFGNEVVARLASIDGSIPNIFQDKPLSGGLVWMSFVVNAYHVFCSARIIHLVTSFNMCGSPLTAQMWSLMKFVLCRPPPLLSS